MLNNIITIDGPSGVGKGTLAISLARKLKWNYLNSGALYRILAYISNKKKIEDSDTESLSKLANNLHIEFELDTPELVVVLDNQNISDLIQTEDCAKKASIIATNEIVRKSLIKTQRLFYKFPGLVAEGRDMGSVIFQKAKYKFFLQASKRIRAERRYKQLKQKGINVSISRLMDELNKRDKRDLLRKSSPLIIPKGAVVINTDRLSIDEVIYQVTQHSKELFELRK
jgi:cytidylate kinase|tara:strand:- start:568 stop:1248 length:681 start_codon:yes stop_codon:yes gene_type:complete